ncbi:MAG: N-acetylmuramoyl-L-alanine amidase [Proteobacteria bacterium]|nr:N-acetylmuramoyl-L-alanine amidase [Pseudomonadota bacterium]MBI3498003.1 N-acetylmuramoyl-L-alanine amidase [Pseudomonadota bacterium]
MVTAVRVASQGDRLRFQLDLSQRPEFRVFLLADPYRVVIDLTQAAWRLGEPPPSFADGPIAGFRFGQFQPGTSRIVLDARQPLVVQQALVQEPQAPLGWRLLVELQPTTREAFLQAMRQPVGAPPASQAASRPPAAPSQPKRSEAKRVVALDPGHGGVDPGTIGATGTLEKNLTLEVAREIKRTLEATQRYRVVLTREDDSFIRLRERIQVARAAGAELFVSLHADALGDAKFHGATVYTLSDKASDAEAEALAQRENKADLIAGIDLTDEAPEVTGILIDLAQRETMNLSARLAGYLVEEMAHETQFLRKSHRFAGFAVLKAPDVPSALIELGYLSNRQDEALLTQPAYRKRLAGVLLKAIDRFFQGRTGAKRP